MVIAARNKMVTCAIFLAQQDWKGVTGMVTTDEELSVWHGLSHEQTVLS